MAWHVTDVGRGQPLVLLPWFGLDGSAMAAAFEPLLLDAPGWRRLYVDLPGTGTTTARPADADTLVDALAEHLVGTLDGRPFAVLGCSYGGYLATAVARRRPGLVTALALVCSGVRIRPEDRRLPTAPKATAAPDWLAGVPEELRDHLDTALGNRSRACAERVARLIASSTSDEGYLEALRANGYVLSDEASPFSVDGPVMVLAGRGDGIAGYADQRDLATAVSGATYHLVEQAGHYLPVEQPDTARELVQRWLRTASQVPLPSSGQ